MTKLATAATIVGTLAGVSGLACVVVPGRVREWLRAFPREVWGGRILSAACLLWVGAIVLHAPLGRFEGLKPLSYVVVPVVFLAIIFLMSELLAARALGALLLLAANPVLRAAFVHPAPARLVMTAMAYAWVIAGILLVLSPYRFRQAAAFWITTDKRCRLAGLLRLAAAALLLGLGLRVY